MKIDAQKIMQAIIIAILFAIGTKAWNTYEAVLRLEMQNEQMRDDLDKLYSLVDDVAKEGR